MAARKQSRGICAFCGAETVKSAMTRHLQKCPQWDTAVGDAEKKANGKGQETLLYLRVQEEAYKDFWLDLEMKGSAPLKELDKYLRAIWLECCVHLSEFSTGGWGTQTIGMTQKAQKAMEMKPTITHIYDFGTESVSTVTLIGTREGVPLTKHPITLLARNAIPEATCARCDEPATRLAMEPVIERGEQGLLCTKHAAKYKDSDYGVFKLVNSPRLGLCGYDGPAKPPY